MTLRNAEGHAPFHPLSMIKPAPESTFIQGRAIFLGGGRSPLRISPSRFLVLTRTPVYPGRPGGLHAPHPAGTKCGRSGADSNTRSLRRARSIRVFTVLTGHSTIAAISSHEYSMQ